MRPAKRIWTWEADGKTTGRPARENHKSPEGYGKTTEVRGRRTAEPQMRFPGPGKRMRTWEGYGKSSLRLPEEEEEEERKMKSAGKPRKSRRLQEDHGGPREEEDHRGPDAFFQLGKTHLGSREGYGKTTRSLRKGGGGGKEEEEVQKATGRQREDFRGRRQTTEAPVRFPGPGTCMWTWEGYGKRSSQRRGGGKAREDHGGPSKEGRGGPDAFSPETERRRKSAGR